VTLCARGLLLIFCLSLLAAWPPLVRAEKKHPAEEKGIKSVNSDVEAKIKFVNKSEKTIKVYWLDFDGDRKLYQTLKDGESCELETFLTHPWVITDENDNAWYLYFPDAQPRTVEVVTPEKK
jgi:von Hippel-Lindau disease tumor supressor